MITTCTESILNLVEQAILRGELTQRQVDRVAASAERARERAISEDYVCREMYGAQRSGDVYWRIVNGVAQVRSARWFDDSRWYRVKLVRGDLAACEQVQTMLAARPRLSLRIRNALIKAESEVVR